MPYAGPPVQLAMLDDHTLFRQGMRHILLSLPWVAAVRETGDYAELLAWCRERQPDVLLLDLQMPNLDGAEVAGRLLREFPELRIVVLSMFSAEGYITQMLRLGARSYLPKEVAYDDLVRALEDVLTTGHHFTPAMQQALLHGVQQPAARPAPLRFDGQSHLTPRELDVLRLLCQGHATVDIAEKLFLSSRTVEGHRQRLLEKTGAANATALVAYAIRQGLDKE